MRALTDPATALAERQRGVIARWQLLRWSTPDCIDGYVRRRTLLPVERGVYRVAGGARPAEQSAFAAALRARPGAVLTGPLVLGLYGVDAFDPTDPWEVLTGFGRALSGVGFRHRPDPLPSRPAVLHGEVRVSAPMDALLESALWTPGVAARRIRLAYDHLRWRGTIRQPQLEARMSARGDADAAVVAFRHAMDGYGLSEESEGERRLGPVLMRLRPQPTPQVWVTPGRRVDWYLEPLRLGWEYDGGPDHGTLGARRADANRDRELEDAGIRLIRVRSAELAEPAALLARTMATLVLRAEELGVAVPRLEPMPTGTALSDGS